jgi:hypothetical protein
MAELSSTYGEAVQVTPSNALRDLRGGAYSLVIISSSALVVKEICGAVVGVTEVLGGAVVGVTEVLGGAVVGVTEVLGGAAVGVTKELGSANAVEITKEICCATVSLGAIYAGYNLLRPVIDGAVKKCFGGERKDQDIPEIREGSLHVRLRCFTDKRFLEVWEDYESGRIRKRLKKEFSDVGIEVEGLKVEIENMEEVENTRAAIYKRYRK